ncbi:MAG: D-alanyl-D-alanine carboxypeptidase/D-alanyl-D-alanine-endopeptidase [Bacteroidetes bacterium]|nr:D-alanyl-D-alanine carboxypeptidase/D-alanyl-D-alanine-endopeptidase [Bacteroidota bacterium]
MKNNTTVTIGSIALLLSLSACSLQKKLDGAARKDILNVPELQSAHVGITVYEPSTNKYWYDYQGNKFFVPASNTKIITCYVGMKYLGDSLPGMKYLETNNDLLLFPTGDPSFLHADYKQHPVMDFLKKSTKKLSITDGAWKDEALGFGWSWDDYNSDDMTERSAMPVYGNVIKFVQTQTQSGLTPGAGIMQAATYTVPEIDWKLRFSADTGSQRFSVERKRDENVFMVTQGTEKYKSVKIPFSTQGIQSALELLKDTVGKAIVLKEGIKQNSKLRTIKSQPVDSLFRPMMHRSDNFFAEQTLLMVSNEKLGIMSDAKIIDTLLKSDLKDLPQRPRWVDGSGLSRYNQFTPRDFVWVLNKMRNEFPWERITTIFATGNTGTLANYYKADSGYIYAKTGTLTGQVALSGYLITKKGRTLIFSVLVNNHFTTAATVRKAVAAFLQGLRDNY